MTSHKIASRPRRFACPKAPPGRLVVDAVITLKEVDGQYTITSSELEVVGRVAGIDEAFERAAQEAEQTCPVARALAGRVDIRSHTCLEAPSEPVEPGRRPRLSAAGRELSSQTKRRRFAADARDALATPSLLLACDQARERAIRRSWLAAIRRRAVRTVNVSARRD